MWRWLKENSNIIFLLVIGLLVRFVFMDHHGLSNDELSGWERTQYHEWNSFWYYGITFGDMHPPFYQVLLRVWVHIWGNSEWGVQSLSILFYLLNSLLIYQISKKYFTKETAFWCTLLYIGFSFPIYGTVFSRPYLSGVFFLLLLFYWIQVLASRLSFSWKYLLFIGLSFWGAMSSHYYAFLVAGVMGVLGLFYLTDARQRWMLFGGGVLALVLYIPFIHITLFQLTQTVGNWIPKPTWTWIFTFFKQYFNDSSLLAICFAFLAMYVLWKRRSVPCSRLEYFTAGIFVSSFLIGFLISVFFTPVLRDMVMLFMLPFFFLLLFSRVELLKVAVRRVVFSGILIVSVFHTFLVYRLNDLIHYGEFQAVGKCLNEDYRKYGQKNIEQASFCEPKYLNFYLDHPIDEPLLDWNSSLVLFDLKDRLEATSANYFALNYNTNLNKSMYLELIQRYFPQKIYGVGNRMWGHYLFKREKNEAVQFDFKSANCDSNEFFGGIKRVVGQLYSYKNMNQYALVESTVEMKEAGELFLVAVVNRKGSLLTYENGDAYLYFAPDQKRLANQASRFKAFLAVDLPDGLKPTDELSIYFWNPSKHPVHYTPIQLQFKNKF